MQNSIDLFYERLAAASPTCAAGFEKALKSHKRIYGRGMDPHQDLKVFLSFEVAKYTPQPLGYKICIYEECEISQWIEQIITRVVPLLAPHWSASK